jgi:1-acyl-sn-glycerol-3-phosphate acyltransferase
MADASVSGAPKSARASATASASGSGRQDAVPRFGAWWTIMRSIGDMSLPVFFSSIHVSNASFVPPPTTPLIVCANHSNTIIDVAVLASHFPHRRPLHFWAKAGFFKNPITRSILTSSGNIKVDRRNKNNQALFQGTFRAMKAGGAIALFPEGGSYTIPYVADLKMGAAWAALEYARYLQLAEGGGMQKTQVEILPTAVVFDDKSKFRSRGLLRFGKPIRLDAYIDEFLSAPSPSDEPARGSAPRVKEDGTVPATPESMTRTNTSTGQAGVESYASPAHRAVARLTADLQRAIEALTFNAPDWETFQATRAARELVFELEPDTLAELRAGMDEHVEVSRELTGLLTQQGEASKAARRALFVYACMLHLCDVDNLTLARVLRRSPTGWGSGLWSTVRAMALRLPLYIPVFGPTLVPMYLAPRAVAHHFARREEESLSSVKTLVGFVFTSTLYACRHRSRVVAARPESQQHRHGLWPRQAASSRMATVAGQAFKRVHPAHEKEREEHVLLRHACASAHLGARDRQCGRARARAECGAGRCHALPRAWRRVPRPSAYADGDGQGHARYGVDRCRRAVPRRV